MNKYPTNWTGGKYRGSIGEEPTGYKLRVSYDGKELYKFIRFKDYNNDHEKTYKAIEEIAMELSIKYNAVENQYRYIDENTIEMKLIGDGKMKTDAFIC